MSDINHIPLEPVYKSWTYYSDVPESCKDNSPVILGVDEAGRGPVIGPMVYAVSYCPIERKQELADLGFADSKVLSASEREHLFGVLKEASDYIGWGIYSSIPQEISESMLRKNKYNLNSLAHDITIQLLKNVIHVQNVNVQEIYIDTVGPPATYQAKLEKIFPRIKITVAKKADSLYPVVSAASICAKVSRDAIIENWKFVESDYQGSQDFGSGYPSDPNTVSWMKNNIDPLFGYPRIVRFSWSTAEKYIQESCVPVTWPEDPDETQNIKNWFPKNEPSIRDPMYTQLGLENVQKL